MRFHWSSVFQYNIVVYRTNVYWSPVGKVYTNIKRERERERGGGGGGEGADKV